MRDGLRSVWRGLVIIKLSNRMPNVREDAQLSEGDINMVIRAVDPAGDGVVSIPALKELLERDTAHGA